MIGEARLDRARRQGDPRADAAVAAIGREIWAVNALLAPIARDDEPLPSGVPAALRELVRPELPAWADLHRLRSAQAFAESHLASITVALFCGALPASYAAARGAKVLGATGRLRDDLDRRVNETARFVLAVLRPGGFDRGGAARIAIGKVRLVHAAVRLSLAARPGAEGVAVNQEDMLGTIGLFSVAVLDALLRLGVTVTARQRDDFVHLWCVTGAMLGVDEDLLPADYAGARRALEIVRARNVGPTEEGRRLMSDLLAGLERHACLPGLRDLPREIIHHLLGEDVALMLGVPGPPRAPWRRSLAGLDWRRAHDLIGRRILDAITLVKLGGKEAAFAMPQG